MSPSGQSRGAGRGAHTHPVPAVPPGPTCLQERSAGRAQERHRVVVDAGHCHGGQAAVGEDGRGRDRAQDGQRVLQVRGSAVQLLRLQLRRDTDIRGLHRVLPSHPQPRGHAAQSPLRLPRALTAEPRNRKTQLALAAEPTHEGWHRGHGLAAGLPHPFTARGQGKRSAQGFVIDLCL